MYLSSFEIACEAFCARLRVIGVKMPFFCISKYVNLFCTMQFKQVKLTKVKSHCSQVNVLSKICTKKKKVRLSFILKPIDG